MRVKGTIFSTGRRQPVNPRPASAKLEAMILTKLRRVTGSASSLAPAGNSRSTHSRNSGVAAISSRLRQYFGPVSGYGQGGGIVFIDDTRSRIAEDAHSNHARISFHLRWRNLSAAASPD